MDDQLLGAYRRARTDDQYREPIVGSNLPERSVCVRALSAHTFRRRKVARFFFQAAMSEKA